MSPVVELCKKFSLPLLSSPKAPPKPTASATSPRPGSRRGHSLPPAFLSSSLTRAGLTPFVIVGIELNKEIVVPTDLNCIGDWVVEAIVKKRLNSRSWLKLMKS